MRKNKYFIHKTKKKPKEYKTNKSLLYKICILFILIILYILPQISHNNSSIKRIFMCTTYNNEAETVYILIWRLYDYVDKFIIVVSNMTHSGLPKNITFKSFEKDIQPYMDKVDIVNFNNICNRKEYPDVNMAFCIEPSQRDYAKTYIEEKYNPTENDLLIVADLDEIITREGIEYVKKHPPKYFYCLKGSMYYPYYYHKVQDWYWAYVIGYNKNMTTLSRYRGNSQNNTLTYDYNPSKPLITLCLYCFNNIE